MQTSEILPRQEPLWKILMEMYRLEGDDDDKDDKDDKSGPPISERIKENKKEEDYDEGEILPKAQGKPYSGSG